ncbi:amidase domain-containing protein [Maledivibacter halophilus]|uniref:Putative amidase domain-containing protein n=1 Tax=Maledivibacter halophilus TaxID=36842 RepID=A0A1T5IXI3_9FIRM|nr:amidase domain-containing protein [Maledivibacter halophilus]SKC43658.1 Putative amidase domain-containing protein [Maledivibacter halophilus]
MLYSYNRLNAVNYARKWALKRNPNYTNFDEMGGDCSNFASQVIHAGDCPMNYDKYGWYYEGINNRAPAWTSVKYLHKFLIKNKGVGPVAAEGDVTDIQVGDLIQLKFHSIEDFAHSLIVVDIKYPKKIDNIFIATHTIDRIDYRLSNYMYKELRFLHILGFRK